MKKNLVLIGYRGTGKSQVARRLESRLGMRVLSGDAEIVHRAGCSIPELVEKDGWEGFRDLESEVVADQAAEEGVILDCGGGAILREENRRVLRECGWVVWLRARPETIRARISGNEDRPSLTGKSFLDEITDVLTEREPIYKECADVEIETDARTLDEIADEIIHRLNPGS